MTGSMLCVSHESALFYWRTNPPWYVLEGGERNIRSLRGSASSIEEFCSHRLPEVEFGPRPIDVLLPTKKPCSPEGYRIHEQKAKLPSHSIYPLERGLYVVSPELCLLQLCLSKSLVEMLAIGMEFCGTYALRLSDDGETYLAQRDYALTRTKRLQKHFKSWKGLHGIEQARRVALHLADNSASPMESTLYLLLCLPQGLGGYHFPKPELNPEIPLKPDGREILRQTKVKPDMLWREKNLVVEYDGEYHNDSNQALRDEMRRAVMVTMGYNVHVVKKRQVYDPLVFDGTARAIAKQLGKRVRSLTLKQKCARENLREALLGEHAEIGSLPYVDNYEQGNV